MKPIIAIALFFVLLFVSGFANAAADRCCQTQATVDQPGGINCRQPAAVLTTTYRTVFAGPVVGWLELPVEVQILRRCQACCQVCQ